MTKKQKTILLVSMVSATTNTILALLKIVIGKIGHSQALVADGLHSFSDLVSDGLVYIAARMSGQEPDTSHPYGHQRIETIATIIIALILIGIGASLSYEAILRLIHHTYPGHPTVAVIFVAVCSILANEWLFRYSLKHGRKINSNLLISNAWHNRSDAFLSIVVLLSAIGSISGLIWLDAVGAILIALLILKMGSKMIWQSVQELIDSGADEETLRLIKKTVNSVPGVTSLHQLRTRLHGNNIFVDCHIIVDPFISVSEGHHIGESVHLKLIKEIKHITDVTVHIDPEDDETCTPSLYLPNRESIKSLLETHCHDLPGFTAIQKLNIHYLDGKMTIELYIPLSKIDSSNISAINNAYDKALQPIANLNTIKIYYTND